MQTNQLRKTALFAVSVFLLNTILLGVINVNGSIGNPPQSPTSTNQVFLPIVNRPGLQIPVFGVESSWIDPNLLAKAQGVEAYWWRYFAFSWKAIEPNDVNPDQYNWGSVNEHHLRDAAQNGFSIVATLKYTPLWAQAINDPQSIPCSPIKDNPAIIAEFVEFVTALAQRYSAPPFNIKYWQFGNEPDVDPDNPAINKYTSPFGCWGDDTDPYFGGENFAKFLMIFSQTVKSVNPDAKVTYGGLLLDCNPDENPTCLQGKFFEGIIRFLKANNGLQYLDYASVHVYNHWWGDLHWDEAWPGFPDGGILLGKIKFLRQVMDNNTITRPIPILITEAGLMCRDNSSFPLPSGKKCTDPVAPPEFDEAQSDYIVWVYVRAIADRVAGVMWYTLNYQSYRHVGLLNSDGTPKPAYLAYQFLVSQIGDATYLGQLNQYFPTLRAYEFVKNSKRIWVMWAPDETDHQIILPAGFLTAYDKLGNPINLPDGATSITINHPVYLIFD